MIEISLAIREACGRSVIRSERRRPHKGDFIEKRQMVRGVRFEAGPLDEGHENQLDPSSHGNFSRISPILEPELYADMRRNAVIFGFGVGLHDKHVAS